MIRKSPQPSRDPERERPWLTQWDRKGPEWCNRGNSTALWQERPGKWVGADGSLDCSAMHVPFCRKTLQPSSSPLPGDNSAPRRKPTATGTPVSHWPNSPLTGLLGLSTQRKLCPLKPRIGGTSCKLRLCKQALPFHFLMIDLGGSRPPSPSFLLHHNWDLGS